MDTLTKCSAHGLGKENSGVSKFVAQAVRGGESARPLFLFLAFQQVHLLRHVLKIRGLDPQQPDGATALPVAMEQLLDGRKNLCIHLCRTSQRVRTRNRAEI